MFVLVLGQLYKLSSSIVLALAQGVNMKHSAKLWLMMNGRSLG
jgi:hypothetical protein